GLVFHAASPRAVSIEQARGIVQALPPFVTVVGLFVDAPEADIRAVLDQVPLDLLQFHCDEPDSFCQRFARPYLQAVRVRPGDDRTALAASWSGASGIWLDSYTPGVPGGTGETFDWSMIPSQRPWTLVLAGGLHADNVRQALDMTAPWAVDVSGG